MSNSLYGMQLPFIQSRTPNSSCFSSISSWIISLFFAGIMACFVYTENTFLGLLLIFFAIIILIFIPSYSLPILVAVSLIDFFPFVWGSPFRITMAFAIFSVFVSLLLSKKTLQISFDFVIVCFFGAIIFFVPVVFSDFPLESLKGNAILLNGFFSAYVAYFFSRTYGFPSKSQSLFIYCCIFALFVTVAFKDQYSIAHAFRLTVSEQVNPNQLAVSTAYGLSLILGSIALTHEKPKRFLLFGIYCLGLYIILLTGSRTSLFASICVFIIFYGWIQFLKQKNVLKHFLPTFVISLITLLLICFIINQSQLLQERFQLSAIIESAGSGRFLAWQEYVALFLKQPKVLLLGVGPSPEAAFAAISKLGAPIKTRILPHNMYIQSILSWGIPGALILILGFLRIAILGYRNLARAPKVLPFLLIMLTLFFIGLGETGLRNKTMWLAVGAITGGLKYYKTSKKRIQGVSSIENT